jgi:hypothetical protein
VFTQQQRLARLEGLCRMLSPQQEPAETLAALGVFDFYPHLAALMSGHQWGPGGQQSGTAYLAYVSLLNQVGRGGCIMRAGGRRGLLTIKKGEHRKGGATCQVEMLRMEHKEF